MDKYKSVYVFTVKNMRNVNMKEVREQWKPSKFFFGKNKVIGIGLGRNAEDEVQDDIHKVRFCTVYKKQSITFRLFQLSQCLKGQCGLLFTDSTKKEVTEWFESYAVEDYARAGFKTSATVKFEKGPLKFSHAIEPYLRKLGMPTKLEKGVVVLTQDYEVCKAGAVLTSEQAKILELMDYRLATFKLNLKACWVKGEGFQKFESSEEDEDEEMHQDE